MAWEDCVVDVHSGKISQQALESMFSRCGAVRTVIHWKGQGEKQHVFMEYKSPSAAEAARTIGLDRNDLQVIKLSNNEMLKRKFRELEKVSENRIRLTSSYPERNGEVKGSLKDYGLPAKPVTFSTYPEERNARGRHRMLDSECSRTKHGQTAPSSSFLTPSFSNSRATGLGPSKADPFRSPSLVKPKDLASLQPNALSNCRDPTHSDGSEIHGTRDQVSMRDYGVAKLDATSRSPPSGPSGHKSTGHRSTHNQQNASTAIIEIPHAGEIIKVDLDKQLEPNPAGIISMLNTVKADQKLWMMTAAYYNGKHNLQAARKVLEAGIDMAAQVGVEADTKPFWHLLSQINATLNIESSTSSSVFSSSPTTSTSTFVCDKSNKITTESSPEIYTKPIDISPSVKDQIYLRDVSSNPSHLSSHAREVSSSTPELDTVSSLMTDPLSSHISSSLAQLSRHTIATSPVLPSGSMDATARLHSLHTEISALREKQADVLNDLSFARAAKRRAEDEVKEERSIRRKLEKHLRAAEDALARSKRMEDAALDQVKREVESRRKAEELLAIAKAEKDRVTAPNLFTHPGANDAAMLLQLASMIRGVPSSDNPWQPGPGTSGISSTTTGNQSDT